MMQRTVLAPAKINLCLHVNGRRPDGYHELQMVMQKISLYDQLKIALVPDGGVVVDCDGVPLAPGEENIVAQAARALLAHADRPCGVEIQVVKQIPVAAGLGGGSSDAAAVLIALSDMLDLELTAAQLHGIAVGLGADVPFFLQDQTVWATGIGDQFSPLTTTKSYHVVLVNPRQAVSTAEVYRGLTANDYSRCDMVGKIDDLAELSLLLHNDLEQVALALCPEIGKVKTVVAQLGAVGVLMSGSGATVFGLFARHEEAELAVRCLREEWGWWSQAVSPL